MVGRNQLYQEVTQFISDTFEEYHEKAIEIGGPVRLTTGHVVHDCSIKLNNKFQGVLNQGESFRDYVKLQIEREAIVRNCDKSGFYDYFVA